MQVSRERSVCEWMGVAPLPPLLGSKLGVAMSTLGMMPINGLRHAPTDQTNGWFVWCCTELMEAPDFFSPLHVDHVADFFPLVAEYLDLPPGHRFLIDGNDFEDVWFDPSLLDQPG